MRDGLVVLLLRERVHRAELLAPARQALDAAGQLGARLVGKRLVRAAPPPASPRRTRARRPAGRARPRLGSGVAELLGAHLGGGHALARAAQPRLDLGLLAGAPAQLGSGGLAARLVGLELGDELLAARPHGGLRRLERSGRALGGRGQLAVALHAPAQPLDPAGPLGALAGGLLGEPALGPQLGRQLGLAHGGRALVGRLAAALDHPLGPAHRLGGLVEVAHGGAHHALGPLALGVRVGHGARGRLGGGSGLGLAACGALGGGDQLVAAVALLEHALLAARRRLAQLAGRAEQHAAGAGHRHAGEALGQRVERLDHPRAGQEALGERGHGCLGTQERVAAARRRGSLGLV